MKLEEDDVKEEDEKKKDEGIVCCGRALGFIKEILGKPRDYFIGKAYTAVYFSCIILAVIGSILRTLPDYKTNTSILTSFDQIEYVCMIFFTIEFVVRLLICPSLIGFFMSILNYVDILPLIPFYANLLSKLIAPNSVIISLKEIFKMFLLFKFFRRSRSLNTLVNTLKRSFKELILYLLYLGLAILIFSRYSSNSTFYLQIFLSFIILLNKVLSIILNTNQHQDMYQFRLHFGKKNEP